MTSFAEMPRGGILVPRWNIQIETCTSSRRNAEASQLIGHWLRLGSASAGARIPPNTPLTSPLPPRGRRQTPRRCERQSRSERPGNTGPSPAASGGPGSAPLWVLFLFLFFPLRARPLDALIGGSVHDAGRR